MAEIKKEESNEMSLLVTGGDTLKVDDSLISPLGSKTPGHIQAHDAFGPGCADKKPEILPYDAQSLRRAATYVVSIGVVFMVAVIAMEFLGQDGDPESPLAKATGAVAVLGALFLFGSVGLMFKEPPDLYGVPDPVLFQSFNAIGIFVVGIPLIIFEIMSRDKQEMKDESIGKFVWFEWFDWLGIVGAVDIIIVSFWASLSTQLVGYAMAPAILNGVGMVTSFIWGKLFFAEPVQNFTGASIAVAVLVTGVSLLAATHIAAEMNSIEKAKVRRFRDSQRGSRTDLSLKVLREKPELPRAAMAAAGFFAGLMSGIFDGALMVPYKLHNDRFSGPETFSPRNTIAYLASFSFGSLLTFPALVLYAVVREIMQGEKAPSEKVRGDLRPWPQRFKRKFIRAIVPGGITGTIWAMGNFLSVHATKHLGMSIGFPLVQTGILVAAVWGVFFFKDINLQSRTVLVLFLTALAALIGGAALLAHYG